MKLLILTDNMYRCLYNTACMALCWAEDSMEDVDENTPLYQLLDEERADAREALDILESAQEVNADE